MIVTQSKSWQTSLGMFQIGSLGLQTTTGLQALLLVALNLVGKYDMRVSSPVSFIF